MKSWSAYLIFFLILVTASSAQAADSAPSSVLNEVRFRVSGERWVNTTAAKVTVAVNAAITENKLASAYKNIQEKLQKIGDGAQWRVTSFQRSQDKTGLEQLYATAEARLSEAQLNHLRKQLKAISVAGETYSMDNVDYSPTLAERQKALTALRRDLYQQIKDDLLQLNTIYPNQKYVVHAIEFSEASPLPLLAARNASASGVYGSAGGGAADVALSVSNAIQLTANVVFGSQG